MITVSQDYKDALAADNRNFYCKAVITFWNGDTLTVDNEDIWSDGFRFKNAVSDQSAFTLGACVINEFKLILNNIYGKFDQYDFDGASVVASFGLYDGTGTLIDMDGNGATTIQKGVYYVDEVDTNGSLITLTCLDAMMFFDRSFADVALTFPATLKQIVQKMCQVCGVTFTQASFNNSTYTVNKRPDDTTLTCRDVLSMVCEIACCYGTIDTTGELIIEFFNTAFMRTTVPVSGNLDGGSFYAGADNVNGGSFYSLSTLHDAGTFEQDTTSDYSLSSFFSFKRDNKDIRIYGVRVSSDSITYLNGSDLYVVDVEGNLLINGGDEDDLALFLGDQLIYASLRPFDASHLGDPSLEAGDTIVLTDHQGNTYYSIVTQTEFSAGERQRTECNAKAAASTSASRHQNISNARITATTFTNGDGAFAVDKLGNTISKTVVSDSITADSGMIGGWIFNQNGIINPPNYSIIQHNRNNANDYFIIRALGGRDVFRVNYETGSVYGYGGRKIVYAPGDSMLASAYVGGDVAASSTQLCFTIPTKPIVASHAACTRMLLTVFCAEGGVPYARSGSSGGTYTQLSLTTIWENGVTKRTNEVISVAATPTECGLLCTIKFTYALAKASGNTAAITTLAPVALRINADFTFE